MTREFDYIQQLVNYIKKNLSKGYTLDSLKFSLMDQGYSRTAISRAIKLANEDLAKKLPKLKEKPVIKVTPNPELANKIKKPENNSRTSFLKKLFSN